MVKQVDAKLDAVWHNDLIPFEQADIFAITRTLERFYDVKIIHSPDIKSDKTYSGVLKKKDNIESVLQSLDNSIHINYKIVGDNKPPKHPARNVLNFMVLYVYFN